jgi:replicative DNA helicase
MNAELPIRIEEQPGLTMSQIATRARRMKRSPEGLDLLVIDHLDLVKPSGRYQGNKVYELGEITAAAKALAKELKIPVVLLCQLNRAVEQREDRRPVLSDLRSSGSIEQDADVVIFLYREEYYLQHNKPKADTPEELQWTEKMADAKNKLVAIIAKQRMGPTCPVDLFCDIASNAVRDLGAGQ